MNYKLSWRHSDLRGISPTGYKAVPFGHSGTPAIVLPLGLEPRTPCLRDRYSNQLSYKSKYRSPTATRTQAPRVKGPLLYPTEL